MSWDFEEADTKGDGLTNLVEEISGQPKVQDVT
jgi:hypothetical protein